MFMYNVYCYEDTLLLISHANYCNAQNKNECQTKTSFYLCGNFFFKEFYCMFILWDRY